MYQFLRETSPFSKTNLFASLFSVARIVLLVTLLLVISNIVEAKVPPQSFAPVYKKIKNSVVHINATIGISGTGQDDLYRFFGIPQDPAPQISLGSGFITDSTGYILTNNHVIQDSKKIMVKLASGKEYEARLIGRDAKTDTALLKIDAPRSLPAVIMGDSERVEVGDWVFAVGSPFGLSQTLTAGIISAKDRVIGTGPYDDFLQTDASINPGNSGGPLFNLQGEVIGINSAIFTNAQGIGFAIPINIAKTLIPQFKKHGRIIRGWLGIFIQPLTDDLASSFKVPNNKGVIVADLNTGGPAQRAGIERGDVIYSYRGKPIEDMTDFLLDVANTPVGTTVDIGIIRQGQRMSKNVTLIEYPDDSPRSETKTSKTTHGIIVQEIPNEMLKNYSFLQGGVVVTGIDPSSPIAASGITVGDIITEVDNKPVSNVKEFYHRLDKAKKGETVLIYAFRGNIPSYFSYIK